MERLSQQTGRSERAVAEAVVAQARLGDDAAAKATAGYYLIGAGRSDLEATLRPAASSLHFVLEEVPWTIEPQ